MSQMWVLGSRFEVKKKNRNFYEIIIHQCFKCKPDEENINESSFA